MPARIFHRFLARLAALFVLTCTAAFAQNTIHVPADQPTIQAGINAANAGDTVLVAPGTYSENIDFKGKAITVISSAGAATTIIDGGNRTPTVTFQSGETRASVLSGFTIQNGAEAAATGYDQLAGGVAIQGSSPSVLNNLITANYANDVRINFGAPLIQGNTITGVLLGSGHSLLAGAAVYVQIAASSCGASPSLTACLAIVDNTIRDNTLGNSAIYIDGESNIFIERNTIENNNGDGITLTNTDAVNIAGNLIINNASRDAALNLIAPYFTVGPFSGVIANNTIANNTLGPQVSIGYNVSLFVFVNNIVVANSTLPAVACTVPVAGTTPASFDHNDIFNTVGQAFSGCDIPSGLYGNLAADPLFVDAGAGDFHLQTGSPSIDAGNSSSPLLTPVDLDGQPRFGNTATTGYEIVDMGAYESHTTAGHVLPAQSSISVTPSAYIQTTSVIELTAQLGSTLGTPQGTVTFLFDNVPAGSVTADASGVAQFDTGGLAAGTHAITAQYSGGGIFSPAVSVKFYIQIQTMLGTSHSTTTLASSLNPSVINQNVTFTATVTSTNGTPTGSIQFTDGSTILGTQPLNSSGIATFSISTLTTGSHTITATYVPTGSFTTSTANLTQVVQSGYPTSTILTSSLNPSISGQNVTFTTTITSANGTPTGSIQFTDNGTSIGSQTLNASGIATLSTSTLSVGSHNITATYIPTGSFAGSSASITQTVNALTEQIIITSSLNPSIYGQTVTITAQILANDGVVHPGGFDFSEGGQFLGQMTVDAFGYASITLSTLPVGADVITAAFTPAGSSHTFAATFTQQVNGLPTATVLTATPTTGVAHITPITLTATVATVTPGNPTPTGQVLFYLNGAQLNLATLVNGVATYTGILPAGADQLYAAYVGDPNHIYDSSNSNTLSVTITAAPSTLSLTSSLNPAPALTPFTLFAQLGIPGSSQPAVGYPITFTIAPATNALVATNASGIAIYNSTGLLPGQYLVTATFAGSTDLQPSTATFIETVTANPTATTLTASPNPGIQNSPVTFTSTVSALAGAASPSGTVTIYDSLSPSTTFTPIATLTVPSTPGSTTVTFTSTSLAPGTHILYAAFTPTAAFTPSQSAQLTLVIDPQSFTLTLSEPNLTLQTGHHHTETASLTSIGGLTSTFTLSCGTLPQYASCGWTQTSVTLPANGTVSTSLTIDTNQLIGFLASNNHSTPDTSGGPSIAHHTPGGPSMPRSLRYEWGTTTAFTLLPLTLLGFKRRRKLSSLLPLLILATLATTLTACGASQYPYSTTPGTYTILVTAAGPPAPGRPLLTQTVVLTLVVTR